MIKFILGFILGEIFGIIIMCFMQINKEKK